jgi:hypothetical protein
MKLASLILFIIVGLSSFANADSLKCDSTGHCTMASVHVDGNGAALHMTGNEFARQVGDKLKSLWPSRVVQPSVVFSRRGCLLYMDWECWILAADVTTADWKFDRRGTLSFADTKLGALTRIDIDIRTSHKLQEFPTSERWWPLSVSTSCLEWDKDTWCLKEWFLVAPRPK